LRRSAIRNEENNRPHPKKDANFWLVVLGPIDDQPTTGKLPASRRCFLTSKGRMRQLLIVLNRGTCQNTAAARGSSAKVFSGCFEARASFHDAQTEMIFQGPPVCARRGSLCLSKLESIIVLIKGPRGTDRRKRRPAYRTGSIEHWGTQRGGTICSISSASAGNDHRHVRHGPQSKKILRRPWWASVP